MKHLILLFLLVGLSSSIYGQHTSDTLTTRNTLDSIEMRFGRDLVDTLPDLANHIFHALKTRKFDSIQPYIATLPILLEHYDSLELNRLTKLADIKYQYMVNNLRKQHFKMVKYCKRSKYSLRNMELVKTKLREREDDSGTTYGEVTFLCQSGSRKFYITFLAVEMVEKWFIADELNVIDY